MINLFMMLNMILLKKQYMIKIICYMIYQMPKYTKNIINIIIPNINYIQIT